MGAAAVMGVVGAGPRDQGSQPGLEAACRSFRPKWGTSVTNARVVHCNPTFGMGLAFTDMRPDQRSILEAWLVEIVSQLRPVS